MPVASLPLRLPLLVMSMLSLLGGVLAGLARLGWSVPPLAANAAGWHAALMIGAFFGAVISLERAVALGRGWAYGAPAAAGLAGILLLAGAPVALAQTLAVAAGATLCAASVVVLRRQAAPFTVVLALGALCWLLGSLGWTLAGDVNAAIPWWLAFLVLTIAGERLELTRFLPTPAAAQRVFLAIVAGVLVGAVLSGVHENGPRLFALGLLALALWLLRYDIARRNVRQSGLVRFIAVCLLSGYAWLALAGVLGLFGALQTGHAWRDAALHAIGLGFVFSMVFGHAPIILPAVTRLKLPYHPVFYVPLFALHASLALRLAGQIGEAGDGFAMRQAGGLANAVALLLFVATVVTSVLRAKRSAVGPATEAP